MIIFLLLGLVLGAVSVVFALQNITTITVVFMTWQIQGSLALIILLAVLTGLLIGFIVCAPEVIKKGLQVASLRKQNAKLNEALQNKGREVEAEKSKLDANNAYIDGLESKPSMN